MNKKECFMRIKELGDLYMYDVLLSYIYPRVFVCEDEFECKYLFYEVDSDEEKDTWLVGKIKKEDYYKLVDKIIPIQDAYKKSAKRNLFVIVKHYDEDDWCEMVQDYRPWVSVLPKKAVYAEKDSVDDISLETLEAARETGNCTFDIRLFPGTDRHVIPQNTMSLLCNSFTSLVDSINGKRYGNSLRVATAPGSCIVRFSFDEKINMLDETGIVQEMGVINDALRSDNVENSLSQVKNKRSFVQSYTKLFKTIKGTGSDVQFTVAYPNSTKASRVDLSGADISARHERMNDIYKTVTSEKTVIGTLVALDTESSRFKFIIDEDSKKMVSGVIDGEVFQSNSYEVPGQYEALLEISSKLDKNDYQIKTVCRIKELRKFGLSS